MARFVFCNMNDVTGNAHVSKYSLNFAQPPRFISPEFSHFIFLRISLFVHANRKYSDQTAQIRRLI